MTIKAVYGAPPAALSPDLQGAVQVSPLLAGSTALEGLRDGAVCGMTMLAPAGTVERRYVIAQALRTLAPRAPFVALALKDRGGARLRKALEAFGCAVSETARHHHRICTCNAPAAPTGLDEAISQGGLRYVEALGLWSQPGVFSWDRVDPGSALLSHHLPPLSGCGADLGCGLGYLARAALTSPKVERISLIDIDRRAIDAARRNVEDSRADLRWADVNAPDTDLAGLDFVVMNPPFHGDGSEDRRLGQGFIRRAAQMLRRGGVCWLVANRHLPYEAVLGEVFSQATVKVEQGGYKVFEARK